MKEKFLLLSLLLALLLLLKPIASQAKVLLLVSQEFPQISIKPLHTITSEPRMLEVKLSIAEEKVLGDLFLPATRARRPALIVAMGVKTSEKDRQVILGFCETLARLGYVVFWPRQEALDLGKNDLEDPQVFVEAFSFLEGRDEVDPKRISFVGFSVGSSVAMVAAEHPLINKRVHSLVFFGGYYNIFDYLSQLAMRTMVIDEGSVPWEPAEGATTHVEEILKDKGLTLDKVVKEEITQDVKREFLRFSPDQNLNNFKAAIFILHEKGDTFVPYVESVKLKDALIKSGKTPNAHHLANLFEHVQPKKSLSPQVIGEFLGLFGFLYKIFMYI